MKRNFTLILLLIVCIAATSCLKDKGSKISETLSSTTLLGKWSLVKDSVHTDNWGLWAGLPSRDSVYIGKPGDYYNFAAHGVLYEHVAGYNDTEYYRLSGDTVQFRYAYYVGMSPKVDSAYGGGFVISGFTGSACKLNSFFITPETASTQVITLSR
jgi:hypothetical protein